MREIKLKHMMICGNILKIIDYKPSHMEGFLNHRHILFIKKKE